MSTKPSAPISCKEFSTLHDSHGKLSSLMKNLLKRLNGSPAATTPSLIPATMVPQTGGEFVPPISGTGINVVIMAIITHKFKATDLHKLDPTNCNKEMAYTFNGSMNQFEVSHCTAKEYKTPFTVLIPLQTYFDILSFHVNNASAMGVFYKYTALLLKLDAEYGWTAIYEYHAVFFNCHHAEMAAGDYLQWGKQDNDLLSEHVYGHCKAAPTKQSRGTAGAKTVSSPTDPCKKFNNGKCPNSPCPWGQPHTCSMCRKADHGQHQHKD
ncbi:hypothetical protein H2248_002773 [Termitomyces sp. 'cryptogamus']|nr:hypothetical protein H2248_002773 [Termitomyces sp. 'cryptogamus']